MQSPTPAASDVRHGNANGPSGKPVQSQEANVATYYDLVANLC